MFDLLHSCHWCSPNWLQHHHLQHYIVLQQPLLLRQYAAAAAVVVVVVKQQVAQQIVSLFHLQLLPVFLRCNCWRHWQLEHHRVQVVADAFQQFGDDGHVPMPVSHCHVDLKSIILHRYFSTYFSQHLSLIIWNTQLFSDKNGWDMNRSADSKVKVKTDVHMH